MKSQNKQIVAMLQAYKQAEVLKAIELYTEGIQTNFQRTKNELTAGGLYPADEEPKDREFYFFEEKYWIQTDEMREKDIQAQLDVLRLKEQKENSTKKKQSKKYTGQKMDLNLTDLKCPKCGSGMYKQGICGGCKEGRNGNKIRLICEDNPDHEILL